MVEKKLLVEYVDGKRHLNNGKEKLLQKTFCLMLCFFKYICQFFIIKISISSYLMYTIWKDITKIFLPFDTQRRMERNALKATFLEFRVPILLNFKQLKSRETSLWLVEENIPKQFRIVKICMFFKVLKKVCVVENSCCFTRLFPLHH